MLLFFLVGLVGLVGQKAALAFPSSRGSVTERESHNGANTPFPVVAGGNLLEATGSLKTGQAILIPVDYSPDSVEAVKQSLFLGPHLEADLVLLHVVHDPSHTPGSYHKKQAGEKVVGHMTDAADKTMAEFIGSNKLAEKTKKAGIKLSVRLTRGLPTPQILHAAEKERACLIAMGSSGKTGLAHLLLGSTAEQVMRFTSIPVMVVKSRKSS